MTPSPWGPSPSNGPSLLGPDRPKMTPGIRTPGNRRWWSGRRSGRGSAHREVSRRSASSPVGAPYRRHRTRPPAHRSDVFSRNRMLATPATRKTPGAQAHHRHVDGQPVGLQCRHHRRGIGVEPPAADRQQDEHRKQDEHPQRPVLRLAAPPRRDQTAEAGQIDELVHVAPGRRRRPARSTMQAEQQQRS